MRNRHRNKQLVALVADVIADTTKNAFLRAIHLLQVLDVVDVIRDNSRGGNQPVCRSDLIMLTKVTADQLSDILHTLGTRNLVTVINSGYIPGHPGRPTPRYVLSGHLRTLKRQRVYSSQVIGLEHAESLMWDIITDVWESPPEYARQGDVRKRYGQHVNPLGQVYGAPGVLAHIDELVDLGYLKRLEGNAALAMLGTTCVRNPGRRPVLLVKSPACPNPAGRGRAKPYPVAPPESALLQLVPKPTAKAARPSGGLLTGALKRARPLLGGDIADFDDEAAAAATAAAEAANVESSFRAPILVDEDGNPVTETDEE